MTSSVWRPIDPVEPEDGDARHVPAPATSSA